MAVLVVLAFVAGLGLGIVLGRRNPVGPGAATVRAAPAAPAAPNLARGTGAPAPTKRGRKAGLTEASFTPSDDILEKLRLAAEGMLDPAEITDDDAGTVGAAIGADVPDELPGDPDRVERERRVLERLRRLEEEEAVDRPPPPVEEDTGDGRG